MSAAAAGGDGGEAGEPSIAAGLPASGLPRRAGEASSAFIPEWVFEHARDKPTALALASPSVRLTWGQLAVRVRRFARALEERAIAPGDRVWNALPPVPGAVVASLAIQLRGATSVEVARGAGATTLRQTLLRTRPRAVVVHIDDLDGLRPTLLDLGIATVFLYAESAPGPRAWRAIAPSCAGLLAEDGRLDEQTSRLWGATSSTTVSEPMELDAPLHPPAMANRDVDSDALVLFTSGSTGEPAGVVLTHRNLGNARQIATALDLRPTDRATLVLPLTYSYGRSVLHTQLLVGGSLFLEPRFLYPRVVLEAMAREGTTTFAGVPLTYEVMRRHLADDVPRIPTLRQLTQAGGAMPADARAWVRRAFADAELRVMYGATEATARLAIVPAGRGIDKDGSIGVPIPGVRFRIVDEFGNDVPRGGAGQLIAAGENIARGYLGDDARTAESFRRGWLLTGDLAREDDDGFFWILGRAREQMKIGGRRASPRTVEDIVLAHPAVADCVACGVEDRLTGEAVAVAVVLKPGRHVEVDAVRRFCRAHLPAWLVPRVVEFLPRLPRGANGKIQRALVADDLRAVARAANRGPRMTIAGAPRTSTHGEHGTHGTHGAQGTHGEGGEPHPRLAHDAETHAATTQVVVAPPTDPRPGADGGKPGEHA